ncbi:MAG: glycosyltransferase [Acidobacteriota bacterium]
MKPKITQPVVSVVIPVFNAERYVAEAIQSVLYQTMREIELLIIDDGSTDNSAQVIEHVIGENTDRPIAFITRENRGVSRTLNEGLKRAKGRYFAYLGADDIWSRKRLELQVTELERTGFGAAYSDCWVMDSDGKILSRYGMQYNYKGGLIYEDLVWLRFAPASPTGLFRREAIINAGAFNEEHEAEDHDAWIRLARKYPIAYIDQPLAFYRVHQSSLSSDLGHAYRYSVQVFESTLKNDPDLLKYRKKMASIIEADQAGAYYEKLRLSEARRFAFRALLMDPFSFMAWRTLIFSILGRRMIRFVRDRKRMAIANKARLTFDTIID